ncbi:MAG: hypothetical protein ABH873_07160 [Candidatus Firestonebacteria bacterium]
MLGKNVKEIAAYIIAGFLCIIILIIVMQLWKSDLSVPFEYKSDALIIAKDVKGVIDNGWILKNKYLGAPYCFEMYDYPTSDGLLFLIIKIISLFTSNWVMVMNIFFIMTFPLVALTTMFVFRQFKVSITTSILGGLLYAFIPYHFIRGVHHLFLSAYFMVPLMVMVILWVFTGLNIKNSKVLTSLIVCVLVSSTGIYYAAFSCLFLIIAGIYCYLNNNGQKNLLVVSILIAVIFLGVIINLSPSIVHRINNGVNTEAAKRNIGEAERYGLRITQLMLPVSGHRIPSLAKIKAQYNDKAIYVNENDAVTLGIIGTVGFIILIITLFNRTHINSFTTLNNLSILNIFSILISTIGGMGAVFSAIFFNKIRAYNRISVFISYFSILAIVIILDFIYKKYCLDNKKKSIYYFIIIIILIVGIFDQTSASFVPEYEKIKNEYLNDSEFIKSIESSVEPGAMIYQMPYVPFPESPPVNKMDDYEHFKASLHSKNIKWSYGSMKGRIGDIWQKELNSQQLNELVDTLKKSGFSGIYINRDGYEDKGNSIESKLNKLIKNKSWESSDERLVFYGF